MTGHASCLAGTFVATCGNLVVLGSFLALAGCVGEGSYVTPLPEGDPAPAGDHSGPSAEEPEDDEVSVVEIEPPVATAEHEPGGDACADGRSRYETAPGGSFSWTVKKPDGTPVVGVHAVRGILSLAPKDPLSTPTLELDFNRTGAFTGQDLRDERLGSTFFGAGAALHFKLKSVKTKNGSTALPDVGNTQELALTGSLDVAGKTVDVEVPLLLSRRTAGFHVSDAPGPGYKIRTEWGLSTPLDALLALAQAQIEETITLRFALDLTESCR